MAMAMHRSTVEDIPLLSHQDKCWSWRFSICLEHFSLAGQVLPCLLSTPQHAQKGASPPAPLPSASAREGRDEQGLGKSAVPRDPFILCPMDVQHRVLYLCSSHCRLHKDRQKQGLAAVRTLLYPSQAVSVAWTR